MRHEFSKKTKWQAWERANGKCEGCGIELTSCRVHYDHVIPDGLGGSNDLDNCAVLCGGPGSCHDLKTRKDDVPNIARAKRRQLRQAGIRKPRTITRWRKFNGEKVIATRER